MMGAFDALLGHVIDLNFITHEAMIEAALLWNLEEYQLDNGPFRGILHGIHTSHIQLGSASRSNGVFIKGYAPPNTYLFVSVKSEGKITHNGLRVYRDELIVLTEKDQLDFTASSFFSDVTIAVDKEFFDAAFKEYFNEPFQYDKVNKRIQLKENKEVAFRDSLKETLADLMVQNTKLQNDPVFHDKAEDNILQILFKNIDLSRQRKKTLESEINANKVRMYIEKNYTSNISIHKIYSDQKISESTIRLSFNDLLGFSPKQYHQCYRLGRVHHAFLQNDCSSVSVGSIAYDHGFLHMGRFSNKYKSMFGRTPSYTLKKSSILG